MKTINKIVYVTPEIKNKEGRLDFVDSAKGFGMLMVIYLHVTINYPSSINVYMGSHWDVFVHSMFMPLFFILSGVFFSARQPFKVWMAKKVHRLIVPFILFYVLTYLLNVVLVTFLNVQLKSGFSYWDIFAVFHKDVFPNSAIWFLLALFWCSFFMYWILKISEKIAFQLIMVSVLFLCGYLLEKTHTNIPLYVDTAFSAVPFFYSGVLMKRFCVFDRLANMVAVKRYLTVACVGILCFLFDWKYGKGVSMVNNSGVSLIFLLGGITGSVTCICLAYIIRRMPVVSYIGRYSMLVLCTHMYLTNAFTKVLLKFDMPFMVSSVSALLLVVISYYVIVPMAKRVKPLESLL